MHYSVGSGKPAAPAGGARGGAKWNRTGEGIAPTDGGYHLRPGREGMVEETEKIGGVRGRRREWMGCNAERGCGTQQSHSNHIAIT